MAAYVKYQDYVRAMWAGEHGDHNTQTLKVALSNAAPNAATHNDLADVTELGAGSGYSAGGNDTQNTFSESGGVSTIVGVDTTFTASGGTIGPFRYTILYNDSHASDGLIAYWDYGSSITLQDGETFDVDFAASLFTAT